MFSKKLLKDLDFLQLSLWTMEITFKVRGTHTSVATRNMWGPKGVKSVFAIQTFDPFWYTRQVRWNFKEGCQELYKVIFVALKLYCVRSATFFVTSPNINPNPTTAVNNNFVQVWWPCDGAVKPRWRWQLWRTYNTSYANLAGQSLCWANYFLLLNHTQAAVGLSSLHSPQEIRKKIPNWLLLKRPQCRVEPIL